MEALANQVVDLLNGLLWGKILIWLLVGTGIYFTLRLGFIQLRHLGHTFTVLRGSRQSDASGISSFQALCTSLAARVGTGNIAGVAVAITLGGPGAIFWMWVIALVGMATGFAEATLAQLFKQRDDKGQFRGGPAYYMERGLGQRWAGHDVLDLPDHRLRLRLQLGAVEHDRQRDGRRLRARHGHADTWAATRSASPRW